MRPLSHDDLTSIQAGLYSHAPHFAMLGAGAGLIQESFRVGQRHATLFLKSTHNAREQHLVSDCLVGCGLNTFLGMMGGMILGLSLDATQAYDDASASGDDVL